MWIVTPQDIINRWTSDDIPSVDDTLLLTLLEDAHVLMDYKVPGIDEKLPEKPQVLTLLKMALAPAIQRAYRADYSDKLSVGSTTGPFADNWSRGSTEKSGLYFEDRELEPIIEMVKTGVRSGGIKVAHNAPAGYGRRVRSGSYDSIWL